MTTTNTTLTPEEVLQILAETGAYREGHFLLTSGLHSDRFFLLPHTFQYPVALEKLAKAMADSWRNKGVQTVVGPATGGILLAYEVARQLGVRAMYTEKTGETMALKRGFSLVPGEKVLVVEDAVTTGGSVRKCIEALRPLQPEILGVAMVVDRTGTVDFGVPSTSLVQVISPSWQPADCPQCKAGSQATSPKK